MNSRKQFLESVLTEEKNVSVVIESTLKKDVKALSKAKRAIEDAIEDAEDVLEERLSSSVPLDKSVVEASFANIKRLKESLSLYKEFEETYFPKKN